MRGFQDESFQQMKIFWKLKSHPQTAQLREQRQFPLKLAAK